MLQLTPSYGAANFLYCSYKIEEPSPWPLDYILSIITKAQKKEPHMKEG